MQLCLLKLKFWDSLEFWQHFCLNTFNSTMARTWRFASKELNNEFACSDLQRNLLSQKGIWNIILCCLWQMKNGLGLIKIWVKASRDALKVWLLCFFANDYFYIYRKLSRKSYFILDQFEILIKITLRVFETTLLGILSKIG